eukprot:TRINITY_DN8872_c0_g1_i2.p2 TRINITY_DN8872_c0_g1~~TRINITY_DN8872_c0_g1_i2.p2  ORF type:complete len:155 (+),score=36.07 TRINITY_DN8872_c0_g1_i2:145-609(+)
MAPVTLDIAEAREAFSLYDRTGRGTITSDCVAVVVRSLGANPLDGEVNELVAEVDQQGTGLVTFPEFLTIMQQFVTTQNRPEDAAEEIIRAFEVFDPDETGFVTVKELRHIFNNLGEVLEPHVVESLVKTPPVDWQGRIEYHDFVHGLFAPSSQ